MFLYFHTPHMPQPSCCQFWWRRRQKQEEVRSQSQLEMTTHLKEVLKRSYFQCIMCIRTQLEVYPVFVPYSPGITKSLGRAWASPTLAGLHCARACVCMFACLWPYTVNFNWARLNFNITKIEHMHSADPCHISMAGLSASVTRSGDDWSWSTHGNLHLVCMCCYRSWTAGCPQAIQILIMVVEVASGKPWINGTYKRQKLSSWF